jgi:release factor glutamine methyltransferase
MLNSGATQVTIVSGEALWQWRQEAIRAAKAAGISIQDVDWFLQEMTAIDRLRLLSCKSLLSVELPLSLLELSQLWRLRTQNLVPVQYLTQRTPWRDFSLAVSPAVLIPRPETEVLVDLAVDLATTLVNASAAPVDNCESFLLRGHWADLGTGSGAISCGLAKVLPNATLHAVEISPEALAIAQSNANCLGLSHRIHFYLGSWLEPLNALHGNLSALVANPPYIPTAMLDHLQPEVAWHEPRLALDGGEDGLACIRHLATVAPDYLISGGLWIVEIMAGQAESITQLLRELLCYRDIQIHPDLAGVERFISARLI